MDVLRITKVFDKKDYVLISESKSNITNNNEYIITIPEDILTSSEGSKKVVININGLTISLVDRSTCKFVNNTELKRIKKSNCGIHVFRAIFDSNNCSFKIVSQD